MVGGSRALCARAGAPWQRLQKVRACHSPPGAPGPTDASHSHQCYRLRASLPWDTVTARGCAVLGGAVPRHAAPCCATSCCATPAAGSARAEGCAGLWLTPGGSCLSLHVPFAARLISRDPAQGARATSGPGPCKQLSHVPRQLFTHNCRTELASSPASPARGQRVAASRCREPGLHHVCNQTGFISIFL